MLGNLDSISGTEKILIVDDLDINVEVLENILRAEGYETLCALSVSEALEMMNKTMPQLILSDYSMPDMNGVEFCKLLKKNPRTRDIPFIIITVADSSEVKRTAFEAGAVDYIPKPFERMEVVMRVNNHINNYRARCEIENHNKRMLKVIGEQSALMEAGQEQLLKVLVKIIEKRSSEQGRHLERVGCNSKVLSQALQIAELFENEINEDFVDRIEMAAKLHDIGVLVTPDEYVFDGNLSETEHIDYIHMHTDGGAALLEDISSLTAMSAFMGMATDIARYHHAHWDGTGHPEKLRGEQIPLCARIVSVVNGFDWELLRREGQGDALERACEAIVAKSGLAYDPAVVKIFAKITKQLKLP